MTSQAQHTRRGGWRRRLIHLTALASCLLALAFIAMWVRSYFVTDNWVCQHIVTEHEDYFFSVQSGCGVLAFVVSHCKFPPDFGMRAGLPGTYFRSLHRLYGSEERARLLIEGPPLRLFRFGLQIAVPNSTSADGVPVPGSESRIRTPYWVSVALLLIAPVWVARRERRRRRRIAAGLCVRCGYDLRASDGQCPECGTRAKADTVTEALAGP